MYDWKCTVYGKKITHTGQKRETRKWFDDECCIARKNVRKQLRKFRKSLSPSDRITYKKLETESTKTCLNRRKSNTKITCSLNCWKLCQTSKISERKINEISPRLTRNICNIPIDSWYSHFKSVLEVNDVVCEGS